VWQGVRYTPAALDTFGERAVDWVMIGHSAFFGFTGTGAARVAFGGVSAR